ncbi:hypothetical protein OROHE_008445 [Orobanche hederae]
MACLVFILLLLSMADHSVATCCGCKEGVSDLGLQAALDYACGNGADCSKLNSNGGASANQNTLKDHCSYAVNSYFQNHGQQPSACVFSGAATIVPSDSTSPSGCRYPSTASSTPTTITPPTPPGMGYGVGTPYTTLTPPTPPGMGYGVGTPYATGVGLNPPGIDTDISDGVVRSPTSILMWSSIILTVSALVFW